MKKVSIVFVFVTVLFLLSTNVLADNERYVLTFDKEYIYDKETGEYLAHPYELTENGLKSISLEEYLLELNESAQLEKLFNEVAEYDDNLITPFSVINTYRQTGTGEKIGAAVQVSNPMSCPTDARSCRVSATQSVSHKEKFSVSVSTSIKNIIRTRATFTWNKSLENNVGAQYGVDLNPGQRAYMTFRPRYNFTQGYVESYYGNTKINEYFIVADSPQLLSNGIAKGTFSAVFTKR
ncbi:hypothetical protein [Alkalihalobacillus pseudalcaliphilus]|uniref:DUF6060 domain-containing protein n=1 Tax=Alkalihalobacillus pseudalcaliphilus TaxID=79884 RepID=UPI00064E0232|nr:hypothetical protein [Alkalihalobacillus pseudalcaliphilus]KMK77936.1 hypothetical protein AB990_00285 [Alkalihalobacillus pseudalcaliphilus]